MQRLLIETISYPLFYVIEYTLETPLKVNGFEYKVDTDKIVLV